MKMTDLGFLTVILKSDSDLRQSFILSDLIYVPFLFCTYLRIYITVDSLCMYPEMRKNQTNET